MLNLQRIKDGCIYFHPHAPLGQRLKSAPHLLFPCLSVGGYGGAFSLGVHAGSCGCHAPVKPSRATLTPSPWRLPQESAPDTASLDCYFKPVFGVPRNGSFHRSWPRLESVTNTVIALKERKNQYIFYDLCYL